MGTGFSPSVFLTTFVQWDRDVAVNPANKKHRKALTLAVPRFRVFKDSIKTLGTGFAIYNFVRELPPVLSDEFLILDNSGI